MPANAGSQWKQIIRATRERGLTTINRLTFWFSIGMVGFTLTRLPNPNWANFRAHATYHLFVAGWLLLLTYAIRSIGSREMVRFWLTGFFPVTLVAFLLTEPTEALFGTGNLQTAAIVPIVEEAVKVLPLVLWTTLLRPKHRHGTLTDFLVLGLAIGAGFSFHEDALYSRVAATGFGDGLFGALFPIFLSTQQFAITHGGWTALAGLGVGLISLHRHRPLAIAGGATLLAVPILDHAAVNWQGGGTDILQSLTMSGRLPAWLLLISIAGSVLHDVGALRWATARDRFFPIPLVREDIRAVGGGAFVAGVGRLILRQRYRRRRNATFIDLFAVRSRGLSAGDRSQVRSELERARDQVDVPMVEPSDRPTVIPPDIEGSPRDDLHTSKRNVRRALLVVGAILALAIVWLIGVGTRPDERVAQDSPTTPPSAGPTGPQVTTGPDDGSPPSATGFGPTITEPTLIRWEYTDQSGLATETILAIDGDRELWMSGQLLQYQEGENSVTCDGAGTESIICFPQDRTGSLAAIGWAGYGITIDVPDARTESRRIAGRDATCITFVPGADSLIVSCTDDETLVQVLLENEGVDFVGAPTFWRTELVEWSVATESDFEIPSEVAAALRDSG